ncbi:hypothetical protein ACLOJK_009175 [Asimina triloba]
MKEEADGGGWCLSSMEALALSLPSLTATARLSLHQSSLTKFRSPAFDFKRNPHNRRSHSHRWAVKMQAEVAEDESVQQMKEMAAARKRWEALIREGRVKVLTPKEAGYAIQLSNKTLLDVRPSTEHKKFISKVEEKFPEDADLIVACQRGLRSLAACEQLYNAGYRNLFWIEGGLEAAEEEDLPREGPQPFKFAGIGGVSEFLGFTDQQRAAAAKEGLGYRLTYTARMVGLILVADGLFFGAQQVSHFLQDLRTP